MGDLPHRVRAPRTKKPNDVGTGAPRESAMNNPRHRKDEQDCEQEADQPPRLEQRMSKLEKIRFIVMSAAGEN